MKLKQIEELATHKVPVWQPGLLVVLLLLGTIVVPNILKQKESKPKTQSALGSTLGVNTIKKQIGEGVEHIVQPYSAQIQKEAGKVLGIAQESLEQGVQSIASQGANQAKTFVFDNTIGRILDNFNTIPTDQQDLIKKAICK